MLPGPSELNNYGAYNLAFSDVREYLTANGHDVQAALKRRQAKELHSQESFKSSLRGLSEAEKLKVAL